ncbi:MAG TPA: TylF/MycF/NovP-related O-methyltransferase [Solirubrobacterales bacterium]|nr:TylF/MycF/NovP-related O-methyltransferase [Solirubrobacterales bacterium]
MEASPPDNRPTPLPGPLRALARKVRSASSLVRGPSPRDARAMYLDLVERALLHTLYDPPDRGTDPEFSRKAFAEALEGTPVAPITDAEARAQGRDWPIYAQTMIGVRRLRNIRACTQTVLADGIPGDLIEAGCWRGGGSILMRAVLEAHGPGGRKVFAADSFQGVPAPNEDAYPADAGDLNHTAPELAVPVEEVRANFGRYGLLDDRVEFLEGWFKDTLPAVRDRNWAVVRLDGDLYESTMDGLENLYPGLSIGGFLIIDDYGWDNCRQAVSDYREKHGITEPIQRIDWVGAYWRRSE